MLRINKYRTHTCGQLSLANVDHKVTLSGWIHNKRDHGGVLFIDLRDVYGLTQVVVEESASNIDKLAKLHVESVISVSGTVRSRSESTKNKNLTTGDIEVVLESVEVLSSSEVVPLQINDPDAILNEEIRLEYRFLDLRRAIMRDHILLRSKVITYLRNAMIESGFTEFQTPILTASSPEGARDFIVPSRLHKGKFYALPQAPQQFKQLLMVSGFDRYFQIAPCFRDEDARADRSPGEFYQLDLEMSFVEQEDVLSTIEPVLRNTFKKFGGNRKVSDDAFPRIKYKDSMLKYGSDKPDLRNPIENCDLTNVFKDSGFTIFANNISNGAVVRGIPAPNASTNSRSFFDNMIAFAQSKGAKGLAYIAFDADGTAKGPIAKLLDSDRLEQIKKISGIKNGDSIFFSCDKEDDANKLAGYVRKELGLQLKLIDESIFAFCWIVDFPYFEWNDETKKIDFSHNPFSMPKCDLEFMQTASKDELLKLDAYQYDIVCNGYELSSGAIRNTNVELMYRAFEIAGYTRDEVTEKFNGMIKAFKYGVPPHGGCAPGIDRIVMLLANTESIREVTAFPMTGKGEDLLMNAPSSVPNRHLKELGISITPTNK